MNVRRSHSIRRSTAVGRLLCGTPVRCQRGGDVRSPHWLFRVCPILVALCILLALPGCSAPPDKRTKLVVWGLQSGEESKGLDARIAAFEQMHPDIRVSVLSMGAGTMNPQKLMTAIVGNVPPDVIHQDRFTIGDWAARDTFRPLDDFISRDRDRQYGVREEDYYSACWKEANYTDPINGRHGIFAVPYGTDDRLLFYNKKLFRDAGIVDAKGDPRPPQTWDELLEDEKILTKMNTDGTFDRIGFIPNYGNSWLYIYSWQNDGEFMSQDGRTCIMNDARNVEALDFMVKIYDALGGVGKVDAFQSGFQSNELDPFLTGKVAMKIDGNWVLNSIARYGPDLDFGVAPAPVPADRLHHAGRFKSDADTYVTWAGGFSFAIPRGSKHAEQAWEFIKWMSSPQAALVDARAQKAYNESKQRPFVPNISANRKVNAAVFAEFAPKSPAFRDALSLFVAMMDHARFRPVTFVGQRLWDEHVRAFDSATHHATQYPGLAPHAAAQRAMDDGTVVVQKELDKVFGREHFKPLDPAVPAVLVGITLLAAIAVCLWRLIGILRLRRQAREEATAGYAFIAPWLFGFVALTAGPILASIFLSFCDYDVLHPARWVGLNNYAELLGRDSYYLTKSLWNVGYTALFGIALGMTTSLAVAMLLNAKVKGMAFYRTFFYLPSIVPVVASAVLWTWVLNGDPNRGLLNSAWKATIGVWFHVAPPGWFGAAEWAKPGLILQGLWGAGAGMILWLAGLQGISVALYEAADLDGAGPWSKFWNVTLPMLSPYIFFNLIMGTIGALQEFDRVYVLSGGDPSRPVGPVDSLLMPVMYLFKNAFQYFKMGYASAIAWILFIIILALTAIQMKLAPRWVHYEAEQK
ncbi:MAG TPA: extracellular solute-binding protein [Chthonomonadaceae bacterium]|nr:extracellular solute-binding protein [Chthonomonadaceae bacterium]